MNSNRGLLRHWRAATLALVCLAAAVQAQLPADSQAIGLRASAIGRARVQEVEARYARASWPSGVMRDGLAIGALELPGWRRGQLLAEGRLLTLPFHPLAEPESAPAFLLEAIVSDTQGQAQDRLVDWLASVQSPLEMPRARARGIELGELGFVGPANQGENALSWIAFVRGSVAARLLVADPQQVSGLDLANAARTLDEALLARPLLGATQALAKPRIESLVAHPARLVAGTPARLSWRVAAPFAQGNHLQWVVGGPGQGYVEEGRDGELYLYTTGPGQIDLTLQLTASNGTVSERAVELEVADD